MKGLCILGSTGSIGTNTLRVVRGLPDRLRVVALCAGKNLDMLAQQVNEFAPQVAVVGSEEYVEPLRHRISALGYATPVRILAATEGQVEAATLPEVELVVSASHGVTGLVATYEAVRAGKPVALANKETLVVAGEFYERPEEYRALANAAGEGAVRMLDRYIPDDEVEALFRAADVTVLPYRSGTQSGVTHVAYALGSPVIATNVGGIGETVRERETGLLCAPADPDDLAATIVRFFEQRMGERMAPHIAALQAEHSWTALASSTVSLIDELKPGRSWS